MEFNQKLQYLRKEREWTQEQLANKIFVSRTAVSKWESGKGYPGIDSIKALSELFSITIDDLLSGEELIRIAEDDNRGKLRNMRDLLFGVLDFMPVLMFFLPFFGQPEGNNVLHVPLHSLKTDEYIRIAFISFTSLISIYGASQFALQNFQNRIWLKIKIPASVFLSITGTMIFIISPQPYAAAFVFSLLIIKGILLLKKP